MDNYEESYLNAQKVQKNTNWIDINLLNKESEDNDVDIDGLPRVNAKLSMGDTKLSYYDFNCEQKKFKPYKDKEHSKVERVYISSHSSNLN